MSMWPVLHPQSLDYVDGEYVTENLNESNGKTTIRHRISGENLVRRLVASGQAVFAVEIAAPHSAYRRIEVAEESSSTFVAQDLSWDQELTSYPVFIRPLVVFDTVSRLEQRLDSKRDGVHAAWNNVKIVLQPGAILAHEEFYRPSSGLSMLRLAADEQNVLPEGSFKVETSEIDGFTFKVFMHRKLFDDLQNPGASSNHRDSILTGALVAGLATLQREFSGDVGSSTNWDHFQNLRALHSVLQKHELPTWEEDNFDPALAATVLKPIVFAPDHDDF